MTRSLILSGGGEYSDPWHPFAATSERIASLLAELGHDVEISDLVADRVADLGEWDMIVVNAAAGPETDTGAAHAGLLAALDRGVAVLAVHVGACTLLGLPVWASVTGAAWITGRSMHPKTGPCRIITYPERHAICAPVPDFDIVDERYTYLRTAPDIVSLAAHEHVGELHPLLWARMRGKSRIVTDLLGHDERSYDSPAHRQLISRAARWLTSASS
jgi:type 1 glutamine amidotransferase